MEIPIINRVYDSYKFATLIIFSLEKRWRYGLGLSFEQSILDLLKFTILAKNAPRPIKKTYLLEASSHLEIARLKLRLFLELRLCNETKVFQLQANFQEIGRMLGGWMRSL